MKTSSKVLIGFGIFIGLSVLLLGIFFCRGLSKHWNEATKLKADNAAILSRLDAAKYTVGTVDCHDVELHNQCFSKVSASVPAESVEADLQSIYAATVEREHTYSANIPSVSLPSRTVHLTYSVDGRNISLTTYYNYQ